MYSSLLGALWGRRRQLHHIPCLYLKAMEKGNACCFIITFFPPVAASSKVFKNLFYFSKKSNSTLSSQKSQFILWNLSLCKHTSSYYYSQTYARVSFDPDRCKVKLEIWHTDQTLQNHHTEGVELQSYKWWWNNNWQSYMKYMGWSLLAILCSAVLIKAIRFA